MTTPDLWLEPELRAMRRFYLIPIAMLVVICVSLASGWANTWNHNRTLVRVAGVAQSNSGMCVDHAIIRIDALEAGWDSTLAAVRKGGSVVLGDKP